MARKSLKPQLNQIRAWVRQGRTDAWIAHQLEVSASQLKDFRRRHGLDAEGEEPASDIDLRDEIEAEIEAELDDAGGPEEDEEDADEDDAAGGRRIWRRPSITARRTATGSGWIRRSGTTRPTPSTGLRCAPSRSRSSPSESCSKKPTTSPQSTTTRPPE